MRKQTRAFTLIELLTVIAIIAILAAIIVPVFNRAKVSANRSADISNMNALRSALGVYVADQGGYPPQLLGYVTLYSAGPNAGNVIPAGQVTAFLKGPKYVESILTFQPRFNRSGPAATTAAVFPPADATTVGTTPVVDTNGDGVIDAADDTAGARQAYGPADGDVCYSPVVQAIVAGARCANDVGASARAFYALSGYDVTTVSPPGVGPRNELRYARFWSNFAIGDGAGFGGGSAFDDPRQLGYSNPPEDTVVTWNSYYREYNGAGEVQPGNQEIALTVGGSAKPSDSRAFADNSWRQR